MVFEVVVVCLPIHTLLILTVGTKSSIITLLQGTLEIVSAAGLTTRKREIAGLTSVKRNSGSRVPKSRSHNALTIFFFSCHFFFLMSLLGLRTNEQNHSQTTIKAKTPWSNTHTVMSLESGGCYSSTLTHHHI